MVARPAPSGHVHFLGVILSSDLSLEKHVSAVIADYFFHLRQIRRVRQSSDARLATAPVQAFVTSRVDYCNAVLADDDDDDERMYFNVA